MEEKTLFKIRLYFAAFITCFVWAFLVWDHFHGGVPSHHLMADKDLPAISNWWGALLLPLLTWYLLYQIQVRIIRQNKPTPEVRKHLNNVLSKLLASLLFGILLSVFFSLGYPDYSGYLLMALLPIALLVPIYRAECLLGFVLGMTLTFGTILPAMIGAILSLVGAFIYLVLRPGILYISSSLKHPASSDQYSDSDEKPDPAKR